MNQLRKSNTKIFHSMLCKRDLPMVTETSLFLYLFNVVSTNHINAWNVEMSLKIWSFPQFKKPHVRPFFPSSLALHSLFLGWRGSDTGSYTSWTNTLTPNSTHIDESFPIHQGLMVPATLRTCYFLTDWKPASATIHQHQLWSLIHVVEFGKSIKKNKGDKWKSQQTYLWKKAF